MADKRFDTPQDALAHYGVKGMKWGVRKDDRGGSTRRAARQERREERRADTVSNLRARAAKADIAAKENREDAAATRPGIVGAYPRKVYNDAARQQENYAATLRSQADKVEAGGMTPAQKRMLIGGAVVGTLALGVTVASMQQSGQLNSIKLRGEAFVQGNTDIFRRNDKFANAKTVDDVLGDVVPGINPGFRKAGGQMNCRRCSMTYELRRRGFDVQATTSSVGYGQSETGLINALTPGSRNTNRSSSLSQNVVSGSGIRGQVRGDSRKNPATTKTVADATNRLSFIKALEDQPAGARGEAVFNFKDFGHSLSYEKFADGRLMIFDTQKGKGYDVGKPDEYNSFLAKWGKSNVTNVELTRLDNLPLDNTFLSRWATHNSSAPVTSRPSAPSKPTRPANMSKELWNQLQTGSRPEGMHVTTMRRKQIDLGLPIRTKGN